MHLNKIFICLFNKTTLQVAIENKLIKVIELLLACQRIDVNGLNIILNNFFFDFISNLKYLNEILHETFE